MSAGVNFGGATEIVSSSIFDFLRTEANVGVGTTGLTSGADTSTALEYLYGPLGLNGQ